MIYRNLGYRKTSDDIVNRSTWTELYKRARRRDLCLSVLFLIAFLAFLLTLIAGVK